MSRGYYYLRRALTEPAWLLRAIKKACGLLREQGMIGILAHIAPHRFSGDLYRHWLQRYPMPVATTAAMRKFSLLLAGAETLQASLTARTIDSIIRQNHADWELLIACPGGDDHFKSMLTRMAGEDARIKMIETPAAVAGQWNLLMAGATGSHVVPISPRFCLHPQLLAHLNEVFLNRNLHCVFWDTDQMDENLRRHSPYFRPDWNLFLARAFPDYAEITAFSNTIMTKLLREVIDDACACQYGLVLRASECLAAEQFHHIPLVLSHRQGGSIENGTDARHRACLLSHFRRCGIEAQVAPTAGKALQIRFNLPSPAPSVAIIMPTRDGGRHLNKAVSGVLNHTDYPDFTLYIVDNNSSDPDTLMQLDTYARDPRCKVLRDPRPFNFAAINNHAVTKTDGTLICLLNDDVEVITPDWLSDMAAAALLPGIGAVGARLWYPDGSLQHGGVILGYGGGAGHALKFFRRGAQNDMDYTGLMREFSAVTAACLVTKRAHFDAVGGLDEQNFPVNFNDVDFCLKLRESGYRILYVPSAELIHHESKTRGADREPAQMRRYAGEVAMLKKRWSGWIADDPAYNPNLTLCRENYSLAWPPRYFARNNPVQ